MDLAALESALASGEAKACWFMPNFQNPLGALMMLALMALVAGLGFTGWLQGTDTFWGVEWVQELHEGLAETLVWLAALHAVAALVMGRIERTRLVKAMFTGVKEHY